MLAFKTILKKIIVGASLKAWFQLTKPRIKRQNLYWVSYVIGYMLNTDV